MNRLNTNYFDNFYIDWQNNEISENYVEFCQKQINNLSHIVPSLKKEKRKIIDTCCGCGFHSKFLIDKRWFCCKVKIICTSIQNYKSKYCFNSKEFC